MQLKVTPSDYAKVALCISAVAFLVSVILAMLWWKDSGFTGNTVVATVCAVVSAVFIGLSSWILAKFTRAERLENVEVNLRFVQGEDGEPKKEETTFKPGKP